MKKFLSLLLALVMTMSLVTISAGATEYKDLTDKDDLGPQYQEAVAVLNKIGVITGYDDGSFRPDVELTRGAAAKIIVSLMIGPEAANNLPNNYAPYPDVPANHTFAGVISYCKTAGIINGYGDGTFKPANDLTGYAFAKMLLSALGYDNTIEKFVDTGWTMNVLNKGQEAGLFDRLDFKGSEAVTRKDAALMAMNTLKATVVEYKNGQNITVTGENTNVTVSTEATATYKTSNQEFARNIKNRNLQRANDDYWTIEFAEEHFIDLRLEHDKYSPTPDDYGRPSDEWSYKKLSIGKFPLVPDFEYTTQVIHDLPTTSDASKTRALGLNGYYVDNTAATTADPTDRTNLWINGVLYNASAAAGNVVIGKTTYDFGDVADIADFTDNGTLVEVYVDNNGSDRITDVVVIKSQLMEVKKVGSDYVSLDLYDKGSDAKSDTPDPLYGFNQDPIDVKISNVEDGDDYFELLSGLKAGDLVVVEPLAPASSAVWTDTFDAGTVYVPETVKGALNGVPDRFGNTKNEYSALSVDVGGTTYKVSLWNKDLYTIDPEAVRVTKKDVTLTLDKYGNTMLAEDVGETSGWMVVGNYRQSIVNGILVTFLNGWDGNGNEISLNIGARAGISGTDVWKEGGLPKIGQVVTYTNATKSNTAEWDWGTRNADGSVYDVYQGAVASGALYSIGANSNTVTLQDGADQITPLMSNDIKFIYVTMDESGELDTIEIKKGRTKVENSELLDSWKKASAYGDAQAYVEKEKDDDTIDTVGKVKAVVIKKESNDTSWQNMLYITDYKGSVGRDSTGQVVVGYEAAMMSPNGLQDVQTIYSYNANLKVGNFARYTKVANDDHPEDFYTLRAYYSDDATETAGRANAILRGELLKFMKGNDRLWTLHNLYTSTRGRAVTDYKIGATYADDHNDFGTGTGNAVDFANYMVNFQGAYWLDLSEYDRRDISSVKELKEVFDEGKNKITVTLLFNDDEESDYFRNVYLVIINDVEVGKGPGTDSGSSSGVLPTGSVVKLADGEAAKITKAEGGASTPYGDGSIAVSPFVVTAPEWVASTATLTAKYTVKDSKGNPYTAIHTDAAATVGARTSAGTYSVTVPTAAVTALGAAGEGAYIELSDLTWSAVVVKYRALGGELETIATTDETLATADGAGTALRFTLRTSNYVADGAPAYTVSGGVKLGTDGTALTGTIANLAATPITTDKVIATGTGYVYVDVTGIKLNAGRTYTFSAKNGDGSGHWESRLSDLTPAPAGVTWGLQKVSINVSSATVTAGGSAAYEFVFENNSDAKILGYTLTYAVNGEEQPVVDVDLKGLGKWSKRFDVTDVQEDYEIEIKSVAVKLNPTPFAQGVDIEVAGGKTIVTVTFEAAATAVNSANIKKWADPDNDSTYTWEDLDLAETAEIKDGKLVVTLNSALTGDLTNSGAGTKLLDIDNAVTVNGTLNKECVVRVSGNDGATPAVPYTGTLNSNV